MKLARVMLTGVSIPVPPVEQLVSWPKFLFTISLWSVIPCHHFPVQNGQRHVNSVHRCSSCVRGQQPAYSYPRVASLHCAVLENRFAILIGGEERLLALEPHTARFPPCSRSTRERPCRVKESHSGSRVSGPSLQGSHEENLRSCESALPRGSQIQITSEPARQRRPGSHFTSGFPGVYRWVIEK